MQASSHAAGLHVGQFKELSERTAVALPHKGRGRSVTSRHSTLEIAQQLGGNEAPMLRLRVPVQMHMNRSAAAESRGLIEVAAGKRQYASSGENGSGEENRFAGPQRWPRWGEGVESLQ